MPPHPTLLYPTLQHTTLQFQAPLHRAPYHSASYKPQQPPPRPHGAPTSRIATPTSHTPCYPHCWTPLMWLPPAVYLFVAQEGPCWLPFSPLAVCAVCLSASGWKLTDVDALRPGFGPTLWWLSAWPSTTPAWSPRPRRRAQRWAPPCPLYTHLSCLYHIVLPPAPAPTTDPPTHPPTTLL
jgi:hypothetical protein